MTNNHVVEGVVDILVTFSNGRSLDAEIVGTDPEDDLAVIRVNTTGLQALPMGNINDARVGDWVVAMGNAVGLGREPTVTIGIISALERSLTIDNVLYNDLIQTDASINPGNSGGPILNTSGQVLGVATYVARSQGAWWAQGTRFAKVRRVAVRLDGVEWRAFSLTHFKKAHEILEKV